MAVFLILPMAVTLTTHTPDYFARHGFREVEPLIVGSIFMIRMQTG